MAIFKVYSNIAIPSTPRSSWKPPYVYLPTFISPILATCANLVSFVDDNAITILGEWYEL